MSGVCLVVEMFFDGCLLLRRWVVCFGEVMRFAVVVVCFALLMCVWWMLWGSWGGWGGWGCNHILILVLKFEIPKIRKTPKPPEMVKNGPKKASKWGQKDVKTSTK